MGMAMPLIMDKAVYAFLRDYVCYARIYSKPHTYYYQKKRKDSQYSYISIYNYRFTD